ncbi:hypothetical protein ACHAPQ_008325 [Fusarium lateritium]
MPSSRKDKGKGKERDYGQQPVQTEDVPWYNRWPTPYREGNDPSSSGYENQVSGSQNTDTYDSQMTDAQSPSSFIYGAQPSSYQSSAAGPSGSQQYGGEASGSSSSRHQDVAQSPYYQSSAAGPSGSQTYGTQASGPSTYAYQENVAQPPRFQGSFSGFSTSQPSGRQYTRYSSNQMDIMPAEPRHCHECGGPATTNPFSIFCPSHEQQTIPRAPGNMAPPPTKHCIICNGPARGRSVACDEHNDKAYLTVRERRTLREKYGGCRICIMGRLDRGKEYCNGCLDQKAVDRKERNNNDKRQGLCTKCHKPTDKEGICSACSRRAKEQRSEKKASKRR